MLTFVISGTEYVADTAHIVLTILVLVFGGVCAWLWNNLSEAHETATDANSLEAENERLKSELSVQATDIASLEATLNHLQATVSKTDQERLTALARAQAAEQSLEAAKARELERADAITRERESLLQLREDVQSKFQELAGSALRLSQQQFLETANETFAKHKAGAKGDLEQLIAPMKEAFGQFQAKVEAIEKVRAEDKSAITEQIKAVGESLKETTAMTGKLAMALSAPKGGGRWGEESLRNVLEMAGLSQHADFVEQDTTATDKGVQRPDVIIRMPGGREIAVDAKVSIEDFLKASDETDQATRDRHLSVHARNVKSHVQKLAQKAYWKTLDDRVDFVAMYIPGENFYAAALEYERDLFDYAARNRVIIVTPSTLVALAKAVAYGWRQEQATENAREAALLARELYAKLLALGERVLKLGKAISGGVASYNELIGSLEGSVLPHARKFKSMGLAADGTAFPEISELNTTVRQPKRGRDLRLPGPDTEDAA